MDYYSVLCIKGLQTRLRVKARYKLKLNCPLLNKICYDYGKLLSNIQIKTLLYFLLVSFIWLALKRQYKEILRIHFSLHVYETLPIFRVTFRCIDHSNVLKILTLFTRNMGLFIFILYFGYLILITLTVIMTLICL